MRNEMSNRVVFSVGFGVYNRLRNVDEKPFIDSVRS